MDYSFMIPIYVRLIKMGRRTIESVPAEVREQVRAALKK